MGARELHASERLVALGDACDDLAGVVGEGPAHRADVAEEGLVTVHRRAEGAAEAEVCGQQDGCGSLVALVPEPIVEVLHERGGRHATAGSAGAHLDFGFEVHGPLEGVRDQAGLLRAGQQALRLLLVGALGHPQRRAHHEPGELRDALDAVEGPLHLAAEREPGELRRPRDRTEGEHEAVGEGAH